MSHVQSIQNADQPRGRRPVETIRPEGLYRWTEFADRIPFSRETWRQKVKAGLAPKPRFAGPNSAAWRGSDLLAWLDSPASYTATTENA